MKQQQHMTTQEVEQLLQRFMDGTSTLQEEAQLAEFFRTHEVVGEWKEYKDLFQMFDRGEAEVVEKKRSKAGWRYAGIASVILLLLGLGFWMNGIFNKKPELVALTDTTKTTPQPTSPKVEEQPQQQEEPKEKADTINNVKEMQRFSRPPKTYMARVVEKEEVRPDTIVFAEPPYRIAAIPLEEFSEPELTERDPDVPSVQHDDYSIQPFNQHRSSTTYEDVERDIRIRGERMNREMELAMSDDLY